MATILVIDDQAPIRELLRLVLEGAGHQVMEASCGQLGLALYRNKPTDLVITDIGMPEMNGLEVISELRSRFVDVKVIAISGESEEVLNEAKQLGARRTLRKPFGMDNLLDAIQYELAQVDSHAFTGVALN